jgi:hypothetical protein
MKNSRSVRAVQATKPTALLFLACLLIPGSFALSQPFPSFIVDTTVTHIPDYENKRSTSVAFGPDVGLVVWATEVLVRGARADRNGVLLDSIQLDIDGLVEKEWVDLSPAVAWGGQSFLVVWADGGALKYALVEPDGIVATRGVLHDRVWSGDHQAAAAFDGSNFLVSWICGRDTLGSTALFCRVSPQGAVLDSPPRLVAAQQRNRQANLSLCFHGDRYLAVWSDWDTIGVSGNFVFPDGSIADSAGFPIRPGVSVGGTAVTHDRGNFLVSWSEYGNPSNVRIARVSDSGVVLDTDGVLIDSFSYKPVLTSNGDTTLVAFSYDSTEDFDSTTLAGVRVDAGMNRLDSAPVKLSGRGCTEWGTDPWSPCIAVCGDDYFVAWAQPLYLRGYTYDVEQVLSRRMALSGEPVEPAPAVLSYGAAVQGYPGVASDGENFLAAWSETRRDSLGRLYYVVQSFRFTADGTRLDLSPLELGTSLYDVPPGVAFGGGCYLVTWQDSTGIWAKRLTPAGVVLDSSPLRMPDTAYAYPFTDAAFGDSFFLVTWAGDAGLHGCRVTPAGALLDTTPLDLAIDQGLQPHFPQVAFDGTNFLVARHDGGDKGDPVHRCVRIGQNGAILDTADITIGAAGANFEWAMPEVAYGKGVYFVVDNVSANCWRISPDGYLLDSIPHPDLQYAHEVFDGTDFMLVCQSQDSSGAGLPSLGAIRITPDGLVLDSTPFTLVVPDSSFPGAHHAAMSANASGRIAAVFRCSEPTPYLTRRIRAVTFPAIVGIGSVREAGQPVAVRVQPNPTSGLISLSFALTQAGPVRVTAFDAAGRRCASLFSGRMKAGRQTLPLDTRRLANGVYFLRLDAGPTKHSARLVVSH